jgi:hypothetical protein
MKRQPQDLTMSEKIKIIEWLALFPALSIFVFTRRRLGLRLVRPTHLIGTAMFIWGIQSVCDLNIFIFHSVGSIFNAFPWVMLAAGFRQRHQRWQELKKGQLWHTRSTGISYLDLLPLPLFLRDQRRLQRFCEPALLFILAMGIGLLFSEALARWVALSAFATAIYEQCAYDRQLENDLTTLDTLIESDVQNETVKFFTEPQQDEQMLSMDQTSGVQTGAAHDIKKQIERLKAKSAKGPDAEQI